MASVSEELIDREREWMEAILRRDSDVLEQILAPDFVYTASAHGRSSRRHWLDMVISLYDIGQLEMTEAEVCAYGDAAVVLARFRQRATLSGVDRIGDYLITDVWIRRDGRWQVAARSSIQAPTESPHE